MSEGTQNIDTSAGEQAIQTEKVSALETELAKYKQAEADRVAAEEEAKKTEMHKRLEALEQEKEDMKKSFDEKLEAVSLRASTAGKPTNGGKKLTKEEYLANQVHYDTLALKAGKNMEGVFNS